jgi:hypothetical protein
MSGKFSVPPPPQSSEGGGSRSEIIPAEKGVVIVGGGIASFLFLFLSPAKHQRNRRIRTKTGSVTRSDFVLISRSQELRNDLNKSFVSVIVTYIER